MTTPVQINTELWQKFAAVAQQQRKRPSRLLEKLLAEFLAIERDLQLDKAIQEQARHSGYKEADAVAVVEAYRKKKIP